MPGFKSKKAIAFTGRGAGKSTWEQMVQSMIPPDVKLITSAVVDGEIWHTVKLTIPAAEWLRQQHKADWVELEPTYFDISDRLYTLLALKWK